MTAFSSNENKLRRVACAHESQVLQGLHPTTPSVFLRGWLRLSGCTYWGRLVRAHKAVQALPGTPAYLTTRYVYVLAWVYAAHAC